MSTRSKPGERRGRRTPNATPTRTVLDESALALGTRIRERRKALGLSLVKVAELTDLSHPFLSQVERGHARPSVTSLQRIAAALEVDAGWLFGWTRGEREPVALVRVEETQPLRVVEGQHEGAVRAFTAKGWPLWFFDVIELPSTFGDYLQPAGDTVCYVLDGTLEVDINGELRQLGPCDALFLDGSLPFRYRSTSAERTHALLFRVRPEAPVGE